MRKEFLLSLLAAGAVPTGALADVNLNDQIGGGSKWQISGLEDSSFKLSEQNFLNTVTVGSPSVGNLSTVLKGLPKGDYVLQINTAVSDNAKVTITGATATEDATGKITFSLTAKTDVTIEVSPKAVGAYTIGFSSFLVTYDQADLVAAISAVFAENEITELTTATALVSGNVNDTLSAEVTRLNTEKEALNGFIADLKNTDITLDTYKAVFDEKAFVNRISKYLEDVNNSNKDVDASNTAYTNKTSNANTYKSMWETAAGYDTNVTTLKDQKYDKNGAITDVEKDIDATETAYINGQIADEVSAFNSKYTDFNAKLAEVYGNVAWDKDGKFTSYGLETEVSAEDAATVQTLLNELETAKTAVANAVVDAQKDITEWAALTDENGYRAQLNAKYAEYKVYLQTLTGTYAVEQLNALQAIWDGVNALEATSKEEANEKSTAYKAAYNIAMGGGSTDGSMAKLIQDVKDNVAGVGDTYAADGTLMTTLKGYKTKLEAYNEAIKTIPASVKDKINGEITTFSGHINALESVIQVEKDAYNANPDFSAQTTELNGEVTTLDSKLLATGAAMKAYTANKAITDGYQTSLDGAKAAIDAIDKSGDVSKRLANTYNSIKESIDGLVKENETALGDGKIDYSAENDFVSGGITNYQTLGTNAANAYAGTNTKITACANAVAQLNATIEGMTKLSSDKYNDYYDVDVIAKAETGKAAVYAKEVKRVQDALADALAKTDNELVSALKAITIDANCTVDNIQTARLAYAKGVAEANIKVMGDKIGAYNSEFNTGGVVKYGPGLADLTTEVAAYTTKKDEFATEVTNAASAVRKVVEEAILNDDGSVKTPAVYDYDNNNDAKAAAYKKANDDLNTYYSDENSKIDGLANTCVANVTAHTALIEASQNTENAIADAKAKINEVGWDESVKVTITVGGEEKTVSVKEIVADDGVLADLLAQVVAVNKDEATYYNKNECQTVKDELLGKYNSIKTDVANILSALSSDYRKQVIDANQALCNEVMKGVDAEGNEYNLVEKLAADYQTAVNLYNLISDKNEKSEAYTTYVDNLLGDGGKVDTNYGHSILQQHYVSLTTIQGNLKTVLDNAVANVPLTGDLKKDENGNVITGVLVESDFDDAKAAIVAAQTAMSEYIDGLTNAVNTYAKTYITNQISVKSDYVTEQSGYMTTAGMSEEEIATAVDAANKHIANAKAYIQTSTTAEDGTVTTENSEDVKSGNVEKYTINMNAALNELSQVSIDTKSEISGYWTAKFKDADALMTTYKSEIDAVENDCLASDFAEVSSKYESAHQEIYGYDYYYRGWRHAKGIKDYADDVLSSSNISYIASKIGNYSSDLDAQLEAAADAVGMATLAVEKNFRNIGALASFNDTLATVRADLATLHEKVGNLGLTFDEFQDINVLFADKAVNTFAEALVVVDEEGNESGITNAFDNREAINNLLDAANDAIAAAYTRAYNAEIAYLNKIHTQVLSDFNNKYAEVGKGTEELTAWDTAIKAQKELIDDAPNHGVELAEGETITPIQQLDALVNIEDALLAIQKEMGVSDSSNEQATDVAVEKLNGIKSGVQSCIDALNSALETLESTLSESVLEGWEHADVPAAAYGVQDELDKIVSAYGDDNSVETSYDYYVTLLNALENNVGADEDYGYRKSVSDLQSEADAELNKRNISNNWANQLAAEIATVEGYYEEILKDIENYEKLSGDYTTQKNNINGELVLDEYGNYTYDEDGKILGGSIAIAKNEIAKARANFSLNNVNTHRDWYYDDEQGGYVQNDYITNPLYTLNDIYSFIDALALAAAQDETGSWRNEAETELNMASSAVFGGKHVNQDELQSTITELWNTWNENWTVSSEVTACARQKMTFKDLIAQAQALVASAEENFYKLGDLNVDGKVTTTDFVALVDIILEKVETPELGTLEFAAADLNEDEEIGVGDAVKEMRIINRLDNVAAAAAAPRRGTAECTAALAQGLLNINNNFAIASVMVDVKGVSASDITLSSRATGMQLMTNTLANGTVRVVVIATDGTTLAGNEGAVLNIAGNATLVKVVAADTMGNEYTVVNNGEATAIESITNAIKTAGQKIYSVGGQMMNTLKKGINIIRNADGTSTKITKK